MNSFVKFYKNKRVLVTGHTGFKGSWLISILNYFGTSVCGYALEPLVSPSLFEIINGEKVCESHYGDIVNYEQLNAVVKQFKPEIILHLAAQPIVLEGYRDPRRTFESNVMGTVNILECVRNSSSVRSFVNVTTDKVYKNNEWVWGYRENDELDGQDPYSNSKSCSELVTHSYAKSFFSDGRVAISTARAGNVIGGFDFAEDRIIPDCVRAAFDSKTICVRNPFSIRPYQHVLESLFTYLLIAKEQWENPKLASNYNIGPEDKDCVNTSELVSMFCRIWGEGLRWESNQDENAPKEARFLKLDSSKIMQTFGRRPVWSIETAIRKTIEGEKVRLVGGDVKAEMIKQISEFMELGAF